MSNFVTFSFHNLSSFSLCFISSLFIVSNVHHDSSSGASIPIGLKFIMPPEEASIEVGHVIKNASMSISSYKISFSINILEKIGNEYIGEFADLSVFNSKLICKFIYDKYIEKLK